MKIRLHSLSLVPALALTAGMMIWGGSLNAQTTTPTDPQTPAQTQQPAPDTTSTPPAPQAQTPSQTPDQTAPAPSDTPKTETQAPAATDVQSFSGTVVKSGDKYVLQEDGGKTYDVDHQDDVAKFEGKRVKVHGTLDPTGKKIMIQ